MKCKYYEETMDGARFCNGLGNIPDDANFGWRDVREELLNWIDSNRGSNSFGELIVYVDELNKKINELLTSPPGADKG